MDVPEWYPNILERYRHYLVALPMCRSSGRRCRHWGPWSKRDSPILTVDLHLTEEIQVLAGFIATALVTIIIAAVELYCANCQQMKDRLATSGFENDAKGWYKLIDQLVPKVPLWLDEYWTSAWKARFSTLRDFCIWAMSNAMKVFGHDRPKTHKTAVLCNKSLCDIQIVTSLAIDGPWRSAYWFLFYLTKQYRFFLWLCGFRRLRSRVSKRRSPIDSRVYESFTSNCYYDRWISPSVNDGLLPLAAC